MSFEKNPNILFILQVMIQPHNRHMSISLYISVLAVADTIALLLGKLLACKTEVSVQIITPRLSTNCFIHTSDLDSRRIKT